MTNASYLRMLAGERFLQLLLNRPANDKRSVEELRKVAAKEVVREQRIAAKEATHSHAKPTLSNAFEVLFSRIWRTVQNARQFDGLMARKNSTPPQAEPSITMAPLVVNEPATPTSNIVQFPPNAPLVRASFSSAKLIDDAEFPSRYHDQTTSNWRASIQHNESINKLRADRSAQLRNASRYVG